MFLRYLNRVSWWRNRLIKISIICSNDYTKTVQDYVLANYQDITEIKKRRLSAEGNTSKISCIVSVPDKVHISDLYSEFQQLNEVETVTVQELSE